jgi:hypothetical protein
MSQEFSLEESESLITNFQNSNTKLAKFLTELSDVSKIQLPPITPSIEDSESNVRGLRSARKGIVVFAIEAAIIVAAATSAAALSGIGPEPVVKFVKSTAKVVTNTVEAISSFVTGSEPNNSEPEGMNAAPDPTNSPEPSSAADPEPTTNTAVDSNSTAAPIAPKTSPTPSPSATADPKPSEGKGIPAPTKNSGGEDESDDGENEATSITSSPAPKTTASKKPESSEGTKIPEANENKVSESSAPKSQSSPSAIKSPAPTKQNDSSKKPESNEKKKSESTKSTSSSSEDD